MVVIDYHTWDDAPSAPGVHHTYGSDRLNPACWPDVKGMMAELSAEPRVEVMISPCESRTNCTPIDQASEQFRDFAI